MSLLDDLGTTIRAVAATVGPSIVGVGRNGRGSGIVIADGRVLTNAHNLRGSEVTITFHDGRSTRGTVAGVDADGDLAVISVDTAGATPKLTMSASESSSCPNGECSSRRRAIFPSAISKTRATAKSTIAKYTRQISGWIK